MNIETVIARKIIKDHMLSKTNRTRKKRKKNENEVQKEIISADM